MRLFVLTAVLFFFFGCGSPDLDDPKERAKILAEAFSQGIEIVPKVINDEHVWYLRDEQTLFTGWVKGKSKYDGVPTTSLDQYKEGRRNGTQLEWYSETGQKRVEIQYKDGKKNGLATFWRENGIKRDERVYEYGKLISVKVWKPNGEKCPITNLNNGNGIEVFYDEDGTIVFQVTLKNGEPVPWSKGWVLQQIKEAKDNRASRLPLTMHKISDLSPLAGLTNLTELYLSYNKISDLAPLAGLTNLSRLELRDNNISDLTPLVGLTNLGMLYLNKNPIAASQKAMLEKALPNTKIIW